MFKFIASLLSSAVSAVSSRLGNLLSSVGEALLGLSSKLADTKELLAERRVIYDLPDAPISRSGWDFLTPLRGSSKMRTEYHQVFEARILDPLTGEESSWIMTSASDTIQDWDEIFSSQEDLLGGYADAQGQQLIGFAPVGIRRRPY